MPAPAAVDSGPVLFARYAYPPNELGYCGPEDSQAILEYADSGVTDGGLVQLDRGFDGAWPYLELIAGMAGIPDPLDPAVVEAYWVGNDLLGRVDPLVLLRGLDERFRRRVSADGWARVAERVMAGAVPHHTFHVFCVYPWVGLLRSGAHEHALMVLDRCRIRWGEVLTLDGDTATVSSRPLVLERDQLDLGAPRPEVVRVAFNGHRLARDLHPGDHVALHWDWVCDRLTPEQERRLAGVTRHHLAVATAPSAPGLAQSTPMDI